MLKLITYIVKPTTLSKQPTWKPTAVEIEKSFILTLKVSCKFIWFKTHIELSFLFQDRTELHQATYAYLTHEIPFLYLYCLFQIKLKLILYLSCYLFIYLYEIIKILLSYWLYYFILIKSFIILHYILVWFSLNQNLLFQK